MISLLRRPAVALALGIVVAVSLQQPALAATENVSVFNFGFNPSATKAKAGDTVAWQNNSGTIHTVSNTGCGGTGTTGPGAFCSSKSFGSGTFSATLPVAGTYSYFCEVHPSMQGSVSVAMKAKPSSGPTNGQFTITWAKGAIPSGYDADVQIERPGGSFTDWTVNKTGSQSSASFVPDAGPGVYKFKTRLQKTSGGGASAYSKPKSITVS